MLNIVSLDEHFLETRRVRGINKLHDS